MGDKDEVVDVKYNQESDWYNASVVQIVLPGDGESATAHHDKGKGKYNSPANDMDHGFDDVVT